MGRVSSTRYLNVPQLLLPDRFQFQCVSLPPKYTYHTVRELVGQDYCNGRERRLFFSPNRSDPWKEAGSGPHRVGPEVRHVKLSGPEF